MKKFFFTALIAAMSLVEANAQVVIKNDYSSPITGADGQSVTKKTEGGGVQSVQGWDLGLSYSSSSKTAGLTITSDLNDFSYSSLGASMCFGDNTASTFTWGLGLGKRYLIEDAFLIQGKIGGYIGGNYYSYDEVDYNGKKKSKDKFEFTYGANANIAVGIKVATSKKGTSTFLTVGYYMSAPKFKTDNMVKNGSWLLGLTFVK